ncbi:hypothetical protein GCM10025762_32620 [Haloechinothrix salitolerans]
MPLECGKRRPKRWFGRVGTAVPGVERTPSPSRFSYMWNMETPLGSDTFIGVSVSRP